MLKNIHNKLKSRTVLHIIQEYFASNKLDFITFIEGTVNTQIYINVLVDVLLSFIDTLGADSITNIVF